jgi:hypothetical protein
VHANAGLARAARLGLMRTSSADKRLRNKALFAQRINSITTKRFANIDKSNPPESFGLFKPVGWIVITQRTAENVAAMHAALQDDGLSQDEWVIYTPQEVVTQIDGELPNASALAEFGQALKVVKAHRVLAENNCSLLMVRAADDEWAQRVADQVKRRGAPTAQRAGHLIIEALTDRSAREVQFDKGCG